MVALPPNNTIGSGRQEHPGISFLRIFNVHRLQLHCIRLSRGRILEANSLSFFTRFQSGAEWKGHAFSISLESLGQTPDRRHLAVASTGDPIRQWRVLATPPGSGEYRRLYPAVASTGDPTRQWRVLATPPGSGEYRRPHPAVASTGDPTRQWRVLATPPGSGEYWRPHPAVASTGDPTAV